MPDAWETKHGLDPDTPGSNSFDLDEHYTNIEVYLNSLVHNPDTYSNPVIHADYSDPDVVRIGDEYYMTASSFNCVPGLPILRSTDLVNWELTGHALKKLIPENVFSMPQHGKGVWAPCIRQRGKRHLRQAVQPWQNRG